MLDLCAVILLFLVEISSKGIDTSVEFEKETLFTDNGLANPLCFVDTSSISEL